PSLPSVLNFCHFGETAFKMSAQDESSHFHEGRLDSGDLHQDVDAIATILEHSPDAEHLTRDSLQALLDLALGLVVHGSPFAQGPLPLRGSLLQETCRLKCLGIREGDINQMRKKSGYLASKRKLFVGLHAISGRRRIAQRGSV